MEVHHHSHTERKKLTHYLWEFLMLFLAVFCGFLAEYQLEHRIEKEREQQFMQSMIEDLETDTSNLRISIESLNRQDKYFDTLFNRFSHLGHSYDHSLYTSIFEVMGWKDFVPTDKTMEQLKYSGGMRLIRKRKAADAMAAYDALLRVYEGDKQELQDAHRAVGENLGDIIDMQALEISRGTKSIEEMEKGNASYLLKPDAVSLGQYYNRLTVYRILRRNLVSSMEKLNRSATGLINTIKALYKMK